MTKHKTLAHERNNLKTHAKALVHATGHIADASVSEVRNRLSQLLDSASESVEEVELIAKEKAKRVDEFIKENPYKAAGAAIGVGFLIGCWAARRGK